MGVSSFKTRWECLRSGTVKCEPRFAERHKTGAKLTPDRIQLCECCAQRSTPSDQILSIAQADWRPADSTNVQHISVGRWESCSLTKNGKNFIVLAEQVSDSSYTFATIRSGSELAFWPPCIRNVPCEDRKALNRRIFGMFLYLFFGKMLKF